MRLAVLGGKPIRKKPYPRWPIHDHTEEAALDRVYRTPTLDESSRFAEWYANYCGVPYVLPTASGTVSIELILRALGIGRGDEVILPPYTFIASYAAIRFIGAVPVFADILPDSYNIDPADVERKLTPHTRAILAVSVGGRPADCDALGAIAEKHNIALIHDAAQAVGATWRGVSIAAYGTAAAFSCQNSKNLTCGEGGIITTTDAVLHETLRVILSGGDDTHIGVRAGINGYCAGILNAQSARFPEQLRYRQESAAYLDAHLAPLGYVSPMPGDPRVTSNAYHLYFIRIHEDKLRGVTRDRFVEAVVAEGIPLTTGYRPLYATPGVNEPHNTPVTDYVAGHEGAWLAPPTLLGTLDDLADVVRAIEKVYDNLDALREV